MVDKYGADAASSKPQPKHKMHTLRFHVNIGANDKARQVDKARQFLSHHDQVRLFVQLRGREKSRPQAAVDMINTLLSELKTDGTAVNPPQVDKLIVTLNPKKHS